MKVCVPAISLFLFSTTVGARRPAMARHRGLRKNGSQGFKGRTHLVSRAMAAAAAIAGHFVDIREWR
jgi:hypothetical protein